MKGINCRQIYRKHDYRGVELQDIACCTMSEYRRKTENRVSKWHYVFKPANKKPVYEKADEKRPYFAPTERLIFYDTKG